MREAPLVNPPPFRIEASAVAINCATATRLGALLVVYVVIATLYGVFTPIYEGPDEIGHILYVKHIVEGRGIPVQSREYAIAYGYAQEGSQAPLYYILNAALVHVSGFSLSDLHGVPSSNPFTTCGQPGRYNVARYVHDPEEEQFPYEGAARAVHGMRLFSTLLGTVTVAAVFVAARLAFPRRKHAAWLAAVLVAFNPQFAFMGGVVNNDNLVNCLTAIAVALALWGLRRGFTWKRAAMLGAVCGLATLAKLGGLMAGVFAAVAIVAAGWRKPKRLIMWSVACGGTFLVVAGWWFARNWILYGDPTGMSKMLSIVGGRNGWPRHLILPELVNTFVSYWGSFACELRFPALVYWAFGLLVVLAVIGWARAWPRASRSERLIAGLLLAWLGVITVFWVRWNEITYAPLGRLFFQANAAIGLLLGVGLYHVSRRPHLVLVGVGSGLLALAVSGAVFVVRPAFGMPRCYDADSAPRASHVLPDARFGDLLTVRGYDVAPVSLGAGQPFEVALFLQTLRPTDVDYALALQLVSPEPGNDAVLLNFNTLPGGGAYASSAWLPGKVIVDRYRLGVPEDVARTQAWRVVVILYNLTTGERVPISVAGQGAGGALGLGLVRVGAAAEQKVPGSVRLEKGPLFGNAIRLEGIDLKVEGETLHIRAWWRAMSVLDRDYKTLIHLYNSSGDPIANGDVPPLRGNFPTSLWQPGDVIADEYTLEMPPGGVALGLGWYDPVSGIRLPTSEAAQQGIVTFPIP